MARADLADPLGQCFDFDSERFEHPDSSQRAARLVTPGQGQQIRSNHDANELPIVTLGSGGGVFRTDQHLVFEPTPRDRPLRDLYRTILDRYFGIARPFGASVRGVEARPIDELLR